MSRVSSIFVIEEHKDSDLKNISIWFTGHHDWGQDENTGARRCPMCLELGPVVTLCMGLEPAFYVDVGAPTFAFNPCGHMATEKTVKWVKILKMFCWLIVYDLSVYIFLDTGQMWKFRTELMAFRLFVHSVRRR